MGRREIQQMGKAIANFDLSLWSRAGANFVRTEATTSNEHLSGKLLE